MIDKCNFSEYRLYHSSMVDIDFRFHAKDVPADIAEAACDAIDELKFRLIAPDTESPKPQKKPVPDPTCDEEAGCKDCNPDQFHGGCEKCSPPPAPIAAVLKEKFNPPVSEKKKPAKTKKGNPYGIPKHLFSEDKAKYQRLWSICKKRGITYEEALKVPKRKSPSTSKQSAKALSSSNDVKEPHKNDPYASSGQQKIRGLVAAKNGEIRSGMRVKHNGSKASPLFGKEGVVRKVGNDGQLFVGFGDTTTWLTPSSVMVIPVVAP